LFLPAGDENIIRRRPVVNYIIIALNVIIFFALYLNPQLVGASTYDEIIWKLGFKPYYVLTMSNLWTIFVAMFLHADFVHLFGNMWFLYIFGDNIESSMGHLRYLVFYILCGIGAVIFHVMSVALMPREALLNRGFEFFNPWIVPAVGASGAISGVLGSYFLLYPRAKVRVLWFIWWWPMIWMLPASVYIGFWFFFQLIMGIWTLTGIPTGVAYWAHIGGFLTGLALTPIFLDKEFIKRVKMALWYRGLTYGEEEWYY